MKEYKIVFTGPVGVGKTTAIRAISDATPVVTDVANMDASVAKATTTVGLDFGELALENGDRLRLYGTPGQDRFDFMWRIISRDALGLIVLIDNSRTDPASDLNAYLSGFSEEIRSMPCVIGITRVNAAGGLSMDDYADLVARYDIVLPLLAVDIRQREDVVQLLDVLMTQITVTDVEDEEG